MVALTGGIGSGKSVVSDLFARHGVAVVDTDIIAHRLTQPGGTAILAIRDAFGAGYVDDNGVVDRTALRALVFSNAAARARLEQLLHPPILVEVSSALAALERQPEYGFGYALLVVPLFFERLTFRSLCHRVLLVDCPVARQRGRVRQRSGLDAIEIDRILAAQVPRAIRLQLADDVLCNGTDNVEMTVEDQRGRGLVMGKAGGGMGALGQRVHSLHLQYCASGRAELARDLRA